MAQYILHVTCCTCISSQDACAHFGEMGWQPYGHVDTFMVTWTATRSRGQPSDHIDSHLVTCVWSRVHRKIHVTPALATARCPLSPQTPLSKTHCTCDFFLRIFLNCIFPCLKLGSTFCVSIKVAMVTVICVEPDLFIIDIKSMILARFL